MAAGVRERTSVELVQVFNEQSTPEMQEFEVQNARPPEGGEDDGTARIEVDLGYRLPDREFSDVFKTAGLCMALSLGAVLLLLASTALLSVIGTVLASLGVLVDASRDRTHHVENEPLHVYAGKRLRVVRQSNAAAAIAAVAVPNAGSLIGSVIASGAAFLYCLATCLMVVSIRRASHRPLPQVTLAGHTPLPR